MRFLISSVFLTFIFLAHGQKGLVRGFTVNAANNQPLSGVKVFIVELSQGVLSGRLHI